MLKDQKDRLTSQAGAPVGDNQNIQTAWTGSAAKRLDDGKAGPLQSGANS